MTEKAKAKELFDRMYTYTPLATVMGVSADENKENAKQCALIAVGEIINSLHEVIMTQPDSEGKNLNAINYYKEVEEEIEKL